MCRILPQIHSSNSRAASPIIPTCILARCTSFIHLVLINLDIGDDTRLCGLSQFQQYFHQLLLAFFVIAVIDTTLMRILNRKLPVTSILLVFFVIAVVDTTPVRILNRKLLVKSVIVRIFSLPSERILKKQTKIKHSSFQRSVTRLHLRDATTVQEWKSFLYH